VTTALARGHTEPMQIHFDDLDAMGIVHNARYAVLLEHALSAYWSRHGFTFAGGTPSQPDVVNAVAEYSIRYLAPIRGTGEIGVHFWIEDLGVSSAVYGFRFLSGDTVHAEGRRVNVKLDPRTLRPSAWTPQARVVAATLTTSENGRETDGKTGGKISGAG
jgi:acyl-CoA thioester hydrolase